MAALACLFLANALGAFAQTNTPASDNERAAEQRAEKIRAECIEGRRIICGKILKIIPEGLVIESGYTDLQRPSLNASWLIPGSVSTQRATNLVESAIPGSPCAGVVILTDLPRLKRGSPRPKQFDYVILLGYPVGQRTYNSAGNIQKTVRCFSATLANAVGANFKAGEPAVK